MKRFEVGKQYRIPFNYHFYEGVFVLLSRQPQSRTRVLSNGREYSFLRWPATVNGKKTWVDLKEDAELGCETFHEISGTTGEWKRHTCRVHLQG